MTKTAEEKVESKLEKRIEVLEKLNEKLYNELIALRKETLDHVEMYNQHIRDLHINA